MDPRWRLTAAGGDPRESATEIKPPFCFGSTARVKWCGKSAPRLWQQRWQGKPHREQDQIGAAGRAGNRGAESGSRPLPGLVARGDVRTSPQMNGRRGGQPPDKTRLTGRLTFSRSLQDVKRASRRWSPAATGQKGFCNRERVLLISFRGAFRAAVGLHGRSLLSVWLGARHRRKCRFHRSPRLDGGGFFASVRTRYHRIVFVGPPFSVPGRAS
jgi:hypothetical protein